MKRRFAFVFILFLAAIPARRADAKVEISTLRVRDKSLQAELTTTDGCYFISTLIRYAESVTQIDGPPVVAPPLTSVEITFTNGCTSEFFNLAGGTNTQYVTIAGDLSRGSLSATVPVSDGIVNANVSINLTWTANAPLEQAKDHHLLFDPVARTITWDRSDLRARSADVAGNVGTVLPVQAGPTFFNLSEFPRTGTLGKQVQGTRTITFLGRP